MRRSFLASLLPAFAIASAWLRIEEPSRAGDALLVAAVALTPALVASSRLRVLAVAAAVAAVAWIAFGAQPWEALPFRDERVLDPASSTVQIGIADFYGELLPFDPARFPEMHALALVAVFGFVAAVAVLVAARRPVAAAAVTVAGAGWPATLVDDNAVAIGAVALAAALSIPLVLRVRTLPAVAAGAVTGGLVVALAVWASPATTLARDAALDWQSWNFGAPPVQATSVRFVWDANYDGISFPDKRTVVLVVDGPDRARYWRASTLDLFAADRWFEDLFWLARVEKGDPVPLDRLAPREATSEDTWLEQRVEVKALVDDRLVATGTPVALEAGQVGSVFVLSGGVLRAGEPLDRGRRYRVWSYAPDPAPAVLARSRARYPSEVQRYLVVDGRRFPRFGDPGRESVVRSILDDPSYALGAYRPLYRAARRVAGPAGSPYEAVLALESWFRQRGGFVYEEQPPRVGEAPLVAFATRTKAGYCQHFAGAMAVMLRMLGVPARVAVGFTSGTRDDGKWVVADRDAHAWVEVWFSGQGWVTFDPTPGRGTFGGIYSFASDSREAVEALNRGELGEGGVDPDRLARGAEVPRAGAGDGGGAPSPFAVVLALAALWITVVGGGKTLRRRVARLTRDPRRSATASRRELEAFLRDQGIAIDPSDTLDDLRVTLGRELGLDARPFTSAVGRARFGPPGRKGRDAAPRRELERLLRAIRLQLSGWARLRGFVSVRSLQRVGQR
jgi:protein-glutamine gamma-glutamyltransferase